MGWSWAEFVLPEITGLFLDPVRKILRSNVDGPHWEALRGLLPAYRSISRVEVGDGASASF